MNDDQNQQEPLFEQALKCPSPEARAAFLEDACRGHPQLRARLDLLLEGHFMGQGFLEGTADTRQLPTDEQVGGTIGRYKLLERIGEGGFGVVYLAEQREPVKRRVALKIIKPGMDTRQVVARFEAERQALALMDHPGIARVFDGGATDSGRPYFVMELVRGVPITAYCDEHQLSAGERLRLFVQVCEAVQHAHQKGIIHRDLKPSNILVTVNDGQAVPKVIDFGVAKATQQELTEKTVFTQFHHFIGTPAYVSPEQAQLTSLDIDTRSDIYALGVLLYELLTVVNCLVSENYAGNSGGGIMNDGNGNSSGTVTAIVRDCILSGNSTGYSIVDYGGGIANIGAAKLTVANTTVSGSLAFGSGGGLYNAGGMTEVTVVNCTLDDNWARSAGGGLFNANGTLTVANSTLSTNATSGNGGGIYHQGPGTATVLNSTLSENLASNFGGGIHNLGTLQLGSTIMAAGVPVANISNSGTITSLGYNLSNDSGSGVLTHPTDQINTDPLLGPLQDNGGPTWTHAPLPGSPAIDQGYNFSGSATDQRGFARTLDYSGVPNAPGGAGTDIGAVEVQ